MLNTQITNVKKGSAQVAKIMRGGSIVWPVKPQFSFYTYQQGGEINFKVWSDTGNIAVVFDGADGTVNPPTASNVDSGYGYELPGIDGIKASGPGYNRYHSFGVNKKRTDINIALFKKRTVIIRKRGTRLTRYGVDRNYGSIQVGIVNDLSDAANFTVTVGSSSITSSIPANTEKSFNYSQLSAGNYNVVITDNTAGTTETRNVNIPSTVYGFINMTSESFNFGAVSSPATTGTRLRKVDVYVLSDTEASNLAPNYSTPSQRAQWGWYGGWVAMTRFSNQLVPLIKYGPCIIEEGTGYTPNSEFIILNKIKLISDSQGRIRKISARIELSPSQPFNVLDESAWLPDGGLTLPTINDTSHTFSQIKYFSTTALIPMGVSIGNYGINNLTEYNGSQYNFDIVHRTNSNGSAPAPNVSTVLTQAPITGDIESINYRDSVGKINAVEFNNLNITKIETYGNEELVAIQTNKTGTVDNIDNGGNLPSIIEGGGNKLLEAIHGNNVNYTDFNQAKFGFWIKHTDTNSNTRTFEISKVYRISNTDDELWGAGFAGGQYEVNIPNKLDLISYGVFTSSGGTEADLFDQPIVVNRPARVNVVYQGNRPDVYLLDGGSYTLQSSDASYDDLIGNWGTTLDSIINPTDGQQITKIDGYNSRPMQYVSVP